MLVVSAVAVGRGGGDGLGGSVGLDDEIRVEQQEKRRDDAEDQDGGDRGKEPFAQIENIRHRERRVVKGHRCAQKANETGKKAAGARKLEVAAAVGAVQTVGVDYRRRNRNFSKTNGADAVGHSITWFARRG